MPYLNTCAHSSCKIYVNPATHHRKKGNQQARNADMIIPSVLAALRSRFILLEAVVLSFPAAVSAAATSASIDCRRDVRPAEMPFICRCLLSNAAATLLLQDVSLLLIHFLYGLASARIVDRRIVRRKAHKYSVIKQFRATPRRLIEMEGGSF